MSQHQWTPISLLLHILVAIGVITQLTSSQLMHSHLSNAHSFFIVHEISGVSTFVIALLIFLSKIFNPNHLKWHYLYPLCARDWRKIFEDLGFIFRLRLPTRHGGGLAGLVQGLGVLLIMAMGLTGSTWYLLRHQVIDLSISASSVIHIHSFLANFVWIYIIGHTVMALISWLIPNTRKVALP